jgi:hypothetical protein
MTNEHLDEVQRTEIRMALLEYFAEGLGMVRKLQEAAKVEPQPNPFEKKKRKKRNPKYDKPLTATIGDMLKAKEGN